MSTCLHDLASGAAVAAGCQPATITASGSGPAFDPGGEGPCFAVQLAGEVADGTTVTGRIEQSDDGTTWNPITGAAFEPVDTTGNIQVIRFDRTARYVRWAATVTGSDPSAAVAAVIGQQKKTL